VGGDQIDVVAADFLQIKHGIGQGLIVGFFAPALMGYGPVLAEHTAQIAVRKKDGTGAVLAHQRGFLAKMRMNGINHRSGCCPAETFFTL